MGAQPLVFWTVLIGALLAAMLMPIGTLAAAEPSSYCKQMDLPDWLCYEQQPQLRQESAMATPRIALDEPQAPIEDSPPAGIVHTQQQQQQQLVTELEAQTAEHEQRDIYSKHGEYAQRIRTFGDLDKAQLVVLVDCGDNAYGDEVCNGWETDLDEFGPEPFNLIHFTLVFGRSTSDWFEDDARLMARLLVGPHTPNILISVVPPEVPNNLYDEIQLNADGRMQFATPKGLPIISIPFNARHQMCPIGERNLTVAARWLCEASTGMNGQHCTISQLFSTDMMDAAYHEIGVPLVFSVSNMEHFLDPLLSITTVNLRKLARYANGLK